MFKCMCNRHVHTKMWSGKNQRKVAAASNATIIYDRKVSKSIEHSIAKTCLVTCHAISTVLYVFFTL